MITTLLERWPTGLPRAMAVAAVILSLASLGLMVRNWQMEIEQAGSRGAMALASAPESSDPLPLILSGSLFGATAPGEGAVQTAPTRLATGYTLRAAFAPVAGTGGGAIIEAAGSEARWYATGETLSDGAVLREVHVDHVVFARAGALERLDFPKLADLALVSAAGSASMGEAGSGGSAGEPIPTDVSPEEKAQIIRQRLEELRNRSRT